MSENNSNFQEVISVSFDLTQMRAAFQQMESEYSAMLGRLSKLASGSSPLSPGSPAQTRQQTTEEQKLWDVRNRSAKALAQYQNLSEQAQRRIAGQVNETANFWDAITRNMGGALGVATKYGLAVTAILEVLHLAGDAVRSVVNEFRTGLAHVREVDKASEELQGTILSSVTFSKNLQENFNLSAEAARQLYNQIEKVAVRGQVTTESIQQAFQSFQSAGGASLTKGTLQESLDAVEQLVLALRAAGVRERDIVRMFYSDLPAAIEGNVKATGRFISNLHIGSQEWNNMVATARTQHNLVEQLTAKLGQFVDVARNAPANLSKSEQALALMRKEWDELLVAPTLPALLGTIERIKEFFESTKAQTSAFAGSLWNAAQSLGQFLSTLSRVLVGAGNLKTIFQFVAFSVAAISEALGTITRVLSAVVDSLGRTILTIASVDTWRHPQRAIEQLGASVKQNFVDVMGKARESWARLGTIANGGQPAAGNNLLTQPPVVPPKPPTENADAAKQALKALKEHYSEQLAIVREGLQAQENALQEAHSRNELSQKDFSEKMIGLLVQARSRVDTLTAQFVQNISGMTGLTPQQKQAVLSNITKQQSKEDTRIAEDISKQKQAIAKDTEDRAMAAMKRELDARKQYASAEISLARTVGATDAAIIDMEVKAREDAYSRE